jgi:hypothetical protein
VISSHLDKCAILSYAVSVETIVNFSPEYFVGGVRLKRAEALRLIYRWTHRDFKGSSDGELRIMILRDGATLSIPLANLSDAEVKDKLPYALRKEAERRLNAALAKKGAA